MLLLLNVEQRAEPPSVKQVPATPHTARASHTREDSPRKTPSEAPGDNGETSESATITAPDESYSIPKIDWQLEIEIAVLAMTPIMVKEEQRRCAEAERTHAVRPFGCKVRYYDNRGDRAATCSKICVIPTARAVPCRTRYRMRSARHRGRRCSKNRNKGGLLLRRSRAASISRCES